MALLCGLCAKDLEAGDRRTLNPKAGDDNRRVVEFLAEYVFEGSHPDFGPKCFVCRACFSTAAKSERALQSTQYELNSLWVDLIYTCLFLVEN